MLSSEDNSAQPATGTAAVPLTARIIPPDQHQITLAMLDRDALFVLKKLRDAGFSGYLVGGGVRDLYLGKIPKDFDISTDARPGQLRRLFPHSNTIGRRFRLVQVFFRGGKTIEVSTLRSLSEHDLDGPEEVLAPNNTFGTLSEDARRRDLTINSLFFEINGATIIDYVNGIDDLDQAIIRIVGEPAKRIARDPVRILRAIRHAARNGFSIEARTWQAITANCEKLTLCPTSRLRDELFKDLSGGAAGPWLELALDSGVFLTLFTLYQPAFSETGAAALRSQLLNLGHGIDRLNRRGSRQPDYLLLALVLIPWADWRYQLFSKARPSPQLFQLGRDIRSEIDAGLGLQLNLSRALRQEMVGILINLAQLLHLRQQHGWPKWLRKKSYFKRGLLLYHLYLEATTGAPLPEDLFPADTEEPAGKHSQDRLPGQRRPQFEAPVHRELQPAKHSAETSPRKRPALASSRKGGIFGLKKK
ncbi:MAG TPA: polya polymerase [Desulforhopalus sp.]|nr:polya polymerase [Desulforhopalus sp.]